jgi:hypothetical protein
LLRASVTFGVFWILFTFGQGHAAWWERLPQPPSAPRDLLAWQDQVVVSAEDGALYVLRDEQWAVLAPPSPQVLESGAFQGSHELWGLKTNPPTVSAFDGAWRPTQGVPGVFITGVTSDALGNVWVSGLNGTAWVRDDDTWRPLDGMEGTTLAFADGDGGVWFFTSDAGGSVIHFLDNGERQWFPTGLATWSTVAESLTVDPEGRANWVSEQWMRVGADGVEVVDPRRPTQLALTADARWGLLDGQAWDVDADRLIPIPARDLQQLVVSGGEPYLLADGRVFALREGDQQALLAPADPPLPELMTARGVHTGDLDGDGRDDLVITRAEGVDVHLHRGGAFPLETRLVRGKLQISAVCDLDGNGRDDVLLREPDATGTARMRLWRSLPGRFEEVPLPFADALDQSASWLACTDVDDDDDLDLLLTARGVRGSPNRADWLRNDGLGRLTQMPVGRRGMSGDRNFVSEVHVVDLDDDGDRDVLHVNLWGDGHNLFERLDDGRLRDVTDGSGIQGVYDAPNQAFVHDVDGDGLPDLLLAQDRGFRAWHNRGGFAFEDATERWGLAYPLHLDEVVRVQLDGEHGPDLLLRDGDGWHLRLARPDGYLDADTRLPALPAGVHLAVLDLDGDGDQDLLPWGPGATGTILGLLDRPTGPAAERWRSNGLLRRVVWMPVGRSLALGGLGLLWLLAAVQAHRAGARIWLGRPWTAPTVLLVPAVALGAVELAPVIWWPLAATLALAAPIASAVERRAHHARTARRIGDYELGPLLGRGGMGDVYLATVLSTGRTVALKLVHPELLARDEDRRAYRREAEHGAAVDDPRVVRILGYGEWTVLADGRPTPTAYLVMEYLRGQTLRTLLETNGPVDVGLAAAIVQQIALGLAAVHDAGLVHRDVKPDNVSLTTEGAVKLMDFGAARRVGQMTRTSHDVLGTLGYLSPEQARGEAPSPATDLYAAGVVLYELLTGRRPFEAPDVVTFISRLLEHPVPDLPDVPDGLADVLLATLSADPDARPPDARALAEALAPWAEGEAIGAVTPSDAAASADAGPPTRSHAAMLVLLGRRYLRYARRGGSPDLTGFALALLEPETDTSHTQPPNGTVPAGTEVEP